MQLDLLFLTLSNKPINNKILPKMSLQLINLIFIYLGVILHDHDYYDVDPEFPGNGNVMYTHIFCVSYSYFFCLLALKYFVWNND